jgi:hypothetical protein
VRGWFSERTELRSGGLGYALILATSIWTYVISRIGVSGLLSRAGVETFFEQGTTELLVICNFWRPLGLFVCTLPVVSMVLFKDANVRPKWLAVALALGGVALNLPISVPRYYAFMTLGVVMFFLFRQRKWRLSPYIGIMFLTSGLFGSFLVNTFRSASSAAELVERFQDIKAIDTDHFYYGDLDAYEMLTYGIAYVEDNQVSWGRGLLGAMLFWIPRSLWSSKPISTGNLLGAEYINLTEATANVNLSAPLVVEGYINFGIFGILGIGISSGWLLGRLSQSSFNADSFVRSDVILAPLMGLWLFVLRGSLMSAFAYTVGIVLAGGLTSFLLFRSKIAFRRF